MKKRLVLLFGLLLALAFVMPSVVAADIEYGPPDIVAGHINIDDILMVISPSAEKSAISFDMQQLQSCSGHFLTDIGQHVLIGFNSNSNSLAMCGHLGGVHSSPFG